MYYENLIIGLLVFSGIIIGMTYFIADISNNYQKSYEDISYISRVNDVKTSVDSLTNSVKNIKITGISYIDIPLAFITGILGTFKLIFLDMSDLTISLISDISRLIGLPAWFTGIITTILLSMIVFATIRILTKTKV